jgi:hypothetical protein
MVVVSAGMHIAVACALGNETFHHKLHDIPNKKGNVHYNLQHQ